MKYKIKFFVLNLGYLLSILFVMGFLFYSKTVLAIDATPQDVKSIIESAIENDSEGKVNVTNNEYTVEDNAASTAPSIIDPTLNEEKVNIKDNDKSVISFEFPRSREAVVNTGVKFSGKTSPGVIVDVVVTDEDINRKFYQHQSSSRLNGNATADKNGEWVFIPQFQFVPGEYSATASFADAKLGTIQSNRVFFTIVDSDGASHWYLISSVWFSIVFGIGISIALGYFFFLRKRRISFRVAAEKNNLYSDQNSFKGDNSGNEQTLRIIDYKEVDAPQEESSTNQSLIDLNSEALDVEKELIDVAKEVNASMRKVENLKRDRLEINKKRKQKNFDEISSEEGLEKDIDGVEEELINVSKEVNEAALKVEDMREKIVGKMRRKK
ncbi:MAG: hypothetical protein WAV73_05675 [Candidatus Moraniibacteriota bacterium]